MKMDRKDLLKMDLGTVIEFKSAGPESRGHLSEIHRVLGGWIYVFEHTRDGHHSIAVGLSSTFVPEQPGRPGKMWDM